MQIQVDNESGFAQLVSEHRLYVVNAAQMWNQACDGNYRRLQDRLYWQDAH